jgi:hypothetical protein
MIVEVEELHNDEMEAMISVPRTEPDNRMREGDTRHVDRSYSDKCMLSPDFLILDSLARSFSLCWGIDGKDYYE